MISYPRVSVIIPVYNLEGVVSRCIESCINQTLKDIEIVVINDGSTDGSERIIENYKRQDSRIVLVNKVNEGLPFARKTGMEQAAGEFIFHLDGDDTIPLDAIEVLYQQTLIHDAEIVAGSFTLIKSGVLYQERSYSNFGTGTGEQFLEFIIKNNLNYLCGKLIKRSLIVNNSIIIRKEVLIGEDQLQMYQLCMFCKKAATVEHYVYNYLINEASITQKKTENKHFTAHQERLANGLFELLSKYNYNEFVRQQINLRILMSLYLALHRTGNFVVDKKQSRAILMKTLINGIFSKKSLLFDYSSLVFRCIVCLVYPSIPFIIRKKIK